VSTANDHPNDNLVHRNDNLVHGNDNLDADEETIDKPESCSKHPLPLITPTQLHIMNSAPYTFPEPEDMTGLPTAADENPHSKFMWADPTPAMLPDWDWLKIPFTNTVFPHILIPFSILTGNVPDGIVTDLGRGKGELVIVLYDAGLKFYQENGTANKDLEKFLHSLVFDMTGINVTLPMAKSTGGKNDHEFSRPWPMIITGASTAPTEFLLWHQTFAVNTKLTFLAHPFDCTLASWHMMIISGDTICDTPPTKAKVLDAIKGQVWNNEGLANFADRTLGAAGVPGSKCQHMVEATKSFDLVYVETNNVHGEHAPVFQLVRKPISDDPKTQHTWVNLIRRLHGGYHIGYHALQIDKQWINCTGCKSQMHPEHGCLLQ
jgi:hypothetical protein